MTAPSFEEVASSRGHKDATMHIGGHGEPWPDIKVLAITKDGQTYVCIRRDGAETVTAVSSVRQGLEMFASELQAAIKELPESGLSCIKRHTSKTTARHIMRMCQRQAILSPIKRRQYRCASPSRHQGEQKGACNA
jgi:hypothetical protein